VCEGACARVCEVRDSDTLSTLDVNIDTYINLYIYTCIYMCIYINTYLYIYIYMCVCTYVYRESVRVLERHRDQRVREECEIEMLCALVINIDIYVLK